MLQILWPNIDHILSKKSEYLHWAEGKKTVDGGGGGGGDETSPPGKRPKDQGGS